MSSSERGVPLSAPFPSLSFPFLSSALHSSKLLLPPHPCSGCACFCLLYLPPCKLILFHLHCHTSLLLRLVHCNCLFLVSSHNSASCRCRPPPPALPFSLPLLLRFTRKFSVRYCGSLFTWEYYMFFFTSLGFCLALMI
ncbi:hypothetical protein M758_5G200000 [Ceratodon purpureus]|nr:hypothetical protein M758_5G200000 [Ceratodon purpureus]